MLSPSRSLEVPAYQVVKQLGTGARSTIWQIRHRQSGELFALKRVIRRSSEDQRFFEQAINEFEVAQHFDHPVIRKIHRIRRIRRFIAVRELHLFMEFCEGQSLQDRRPHAMSDITHIFSNVAEAIAQMNATGWVHADLKPNNIVVADDGTIKIIDLGQSCPAGKIKQRIQGTPDYIAPEQVQRQPLDARTDVYNLGATIYWALTGNAIPTAMPKKGVATLKEDMSVKPPERINPRVPPALSKLVLDCIEVLPTRRPENMNVVASRLDMVRRALNRDNGPTAAP